MFEHGDTVAASPTHKSRRRVDVVAPATVASVNRCDTVWYDIPHSIHAFILARGNRAATPRQRIRVRRVTCCGRRRNVFCTRLLTDRTLLRRNAVAVFALPIPGLSRSYSWEEHNGKLMSFRFIRTEQWDAYYPNVSRRIVLHLLSIIRTGFPKIHARDIKRYVVNIRSVLLQIKSVAINIKFEKIYFSLKSGKYFFNSAGKKFPSFREL